MKERDSKGERERERGRKERERERGREIQRFSLQMSQIIFPYSVSSANSFNFFMDKFTLKREIKGKKVLRFRTASHNIINYIYCI